MKKPIPNSVCDDCLNAECVWRAPSLGIDPPVMDCPDKKAPPVTKYDRLISKSLEELAEYLAPCACPPIHFNKTGVIDCPVGKEPCESDCKNCWINWLKEEAKE